MAAKPILGRGDALSGSELAGCSRFIGSIDEFVIASEKKLKNFENENRNGEESVSIINEIGAMNGLAWPTAQALLSAKLKC